LTSPTLQLANPSCADLSNKGSYFTVSVGVGTPPQYFDLVADTGSDAVIVTSCVCVDSGLCLKNDKCFRGTNHSDTFDVLMGNDSGEAGPMGVSMTFGSGTVTAVIASDMVEVGGLKAMMKEGLLLMVDRRMLRVQGQFEGILGLGPPQKTLDAPKTSNKSQKQWSPATRPADLKPNASVHSYAPKLFLEQAHASRYSICFNDAGKPGALRLDLPAFKNPLPAVGTFHWGLGLYGISVGSSQAPSLACHASDMKPGQQTPCGAIPDSGTTLMMGPKDQVVDLFGSLCDNWERCKTARQGKLKNMSASHAFQTLLYECGTWKDNETGINEVPSVFLTVGGKDHQQQLEITPWAYIIETQQEEYNTSVKYLLGVIPVVVGIPTGHTKKVCVPSFGVQEYPTKENGPVWILGTPLFYQFSVGYDIGGPNMAFMTEKCDSCNSAQTPPSLLSSQKQLHPSQPKWARPMRTLTTPPRVPHFDKSVPL